jgi:phytanoyl-CoA hydroxylase
LFSRTWKPRIQTNFSLASICRRGYTANGVVKGDEYILPPGAKESYERDGYIICRNFLTEAELKPLEVIYEKFMRREIKVPGTDFCDMSQSFDTKFEDYQIINAMLPRKYYPALVGSIYERRSASVARQLFPDVKMDIDYDQLLDKRPNKAGAVFAWHQDMVCSHSHCNHAMSEG